MHGTCYYKSKKYCPVSLESCSHSSNKGYKWVIKGKIGFSLLRIMNKIMLIGICKDKLSDCPNMSIKETCTNVSCKQDEYFCNPKVKCQISNFSFNKFSFMLRAVYQNLFPVIIYVQET